MDFIDQAALVLLATLLPLVARLDSRRRLAGWLAAGVLGAGLWVAERSLTAAGLTLADGIRLARGGDLAWLVWSAAVVVAATIWLSAAWPSSSPGAWSAGRASTSQGRPFTSARTAASGGSVARPKATTGRPAPTQPRPAAPKSASAGASARDVGTASSGAVAVFPICPTCLEPVTQDGAACVRGHVSHRVCLDSGGRCCACMSV